MAGDNGKVKEEVKVNDQQKLTSIKVGDKEYKVVNSVTMIELVVHKLEDGQELSQVLAHEFMMTDHKAYMVELLTKAINTVMRAKKRQSTIATVSNLVLNKMFNARPRIKDIFKRK